MTEAWGRGRAEKKRKRACPPPNLDDTITLMTFIPNYFRLRTSVCVCVCVCVCKENEKSRNSCYSSVVMN